MWTREEHIIERVCCSVGQSVTYGHVSCATTQVRAPPYPLVLSVPFTFQLMSSLSWSASKRHKSTKTSIIKNTSKRPLWGNMSTGQIAFRKIWRKTIKHPFSKDYQKYKDVYFIFYTWQGTRSVEQKQNISLKSNPRALFFIVKGCKSSPLCAKCGHFLSRSSCENWIFPSHLKLYCS